MHSLFPTVGKNAGGSGVVAAMENALLVGLTAQMALRRNMEIIANNLANVSTSGFKRESPVFEELLVPVDGDTTDSSVKEVSFVKNWGVLRDMSVGSLAQTGSPLDVAIEAKGFFVVNTAAGERYTRDGHFKIDSEGRIVTADGDPVSSEGGEITIPRGQTEIKIANDGTVSTERGVAGKFRIVDLPQGSLKKEGKNLYSADAPPIEPEKTSVLQGMIERSNVEPVFEMTKMIEVLRAYQHSTETLNATDETMRRAVQRLGEVRV